MSVYLEWCDSLDVVGELPGEVVGVHHGNVHSLASLMYRVSYPYQSIAGDYHRACLPSDYVYGRLRLLALNVDTT